MTTVYLCIFLLNILYLKNSNYSAAKEIIQKTTETQRAQRDTEMITQKYINEISYKIT
mgnify:CR=1 FL=1